VSVVREKSQFTGLRRFSRWKRTYEAKTTAIMAGRTATRSSGRDPRARSVAGTVVRK
jgi:hypothetical protein